MSAYAVGQTFEFGSGTIYQCVYTCTVIGQIYIASNFHRFFFFFKFLFCMCKITPTSRDFSPSRLLPRSIAPALSQSWCVYSLILGDDERG